MSPTSQRPLQRATVAAVFLFLVVAASAVHAREYARGHHPNGLGLDVRHHRDRHYPSPGFAFKPRYSGNIGFSFRGGGHLHNGGIWLRPPRIVIPVLPSAFATVWIGGLPYYYADGVYYATSPGQGYTVVQPPPEPAQVIPPQPPPLMAPVPPQELILYPRNGQSAQQTQADRQECMQWASAQVNAQEPSVFQRALTACLDGRGYSTR